MFRLKESIHVSAPMDRCFLLSTSIELVERTIALKPVEGKTSGLVVGGDQLVWRGWKFGLPAMHETLITAYERPKYFQDTMGRGRFRFFQHDHHFERIDGQTVMWDVVRFSMPLGPVGRWIGRMIVVPHVLRLMRQRMELLRRIAEGSDWERYVVDATESEGITSTAR
jgi:ligand-binding SRPBCC domain-containing protein